MEDWKYEIRQSLVEVAKMGVYLIGLALVLAVALGVFGLVLYVVLVWSGVLV